ncbi:MAG: hypothetical protein C5B49_11910 [Bdellovibrio sp.]|nr:MAG: hypothetical protein C5B49_11910 [Bdellovibrio sp.]
MRFRLFQEFLIALLFIPFNVKAADKIFIIGNSDQLNDITRWDQALTFFVFEKLEKIAQSVPNLSIELIEVSTLADLRKELPKHLGGDSLRGLFILGHGNDSYYGLNKKEKKDGHEMGSFLRGLLQPLRRSHYLTIYFNGCETGPTS